MQSSLLNRLGGLSLIIGGLYGVIWGFANVIPSVLVIFGLVILHKNQSKEAGLLGRIGIIIAVIGCLLNASIEIMRWLPRMNLKVPTFQVLFVSGLFVIGILLYAIATNRAKIYPNWGSWLLMVGVVLMPLLGSLGGLIVGLGFIVLGFTLVRGKFLRDENQEYAFIE